MLLRNVVENKVHKERMSMLYAFEQLIINTEDGDEDLEEEEYDFYGEDPNQPYDPMNEEEYQ